MGDVILVSPALTALKERVDGAHITLLTRAPYADLHRNNPACDEVWGYDPALQNLRELRRQVSESSFDFIVDLHGSLRSRLLTFALGIPVARWKQPRWQRFWIVARPPLKQKNQLTPVIELYLQAVGGKAGSSHPGVSEPAATVPVIHLNEEQRTAGERWREKFTNGRPGECIAILPGAKHPPKEWPLYRVRELAELLVSRGDIPVIIPPPDDPEPAFSLDHEVEGACICDPVPGIMELAGILASCDGAVANDSGPMHLAAAVATPTVGLFGPTSPALGFSPRGLYTAAIHRDLYCSPCSKHGQRVCWRRDRECLIDIGPREVIDLLEDLMGEKQSQKTLDL